MSDKTLEFALEDQNVQQSFSSDSSLTNWAEITDLNGGNYASGLVTFSNINLINSSNGAVYDLKEALIHIPILKRATITNGYFNQEGTTAGTSLFPTNKFAVSNKATHHYFHNVWSKFGSVQLEKNNSGYVNFYTNERKKKKTVIDTISDDIDGIYFDSADSYQFDFTANNTTGEKNNWSKQNYDLTNAPYLTSHNQAIYKRNGHFIDATNPANTALLPSNSEMGSIYQPYFINNATTLQWYDVLVCKLSDLNPAFAEMPPVFHLNGLEIKVQMNCGSNFSVTVNYTKVGSAQTTTSGDKNTIFNPSSITANLGNGQTCPFLLASASNDGLSGLSFNQSGDAAVSIKLECTIGWGAANSAPARLLIPYHHLNEKALSHYENNPIYTFYSNNFYLDNTIVNIKHGQMVQKTLATQYNRPRKMYILPFLSNQNSVGTTPTFMISPFQSCLSSAPTTVSPVKLKNFNILLGGNSLFSQQQLYSPAQFYDENYKFLNSLDFSYDNAEKNPLKSGRIKKSDWLKGPYGVYVVDLEKSIADADDETAQSIAVQWIVDTNAGATQYTYDFYLIIETAYKYSVDCINGTLVPGDVFNQKP